MRFRLTSSALLQNVKSIFSLTELSGTPFDTTVCYNALLQNLKPIFSLTEQSGTSNAVLMQIRLRRTSQNWRKTLNKDRINIMKRFYIEKFMYNSYTYGHLCLEKSTFISIIAL